PRPTADRHTFPTRRSSDLARDRHAERLGIGSPPVVAQQEGDVHAVREFRGSSKAALGIVESAGHLAEGAMAGRFDNAEGGFGGAERKSTRLNSSHVSISYA